MSWQPPAGPGYPPPGWTNPAQGFWGATPWGAPPGFQASPPPPGWAQAPPGWAQASPPPPGWAPQMTPGPSDAPGPAPHGPPQPHAPSAPAQRRFVRRVNTNQENENTKDGASLGLPPVPVYADDDGRLSNAYKALGQEWKLGKGQCTSFAFRISLAEACDADRFPRVKLSQQSTEAIDLLLFVLCGIQPATKPKNLGVESKGDARRQFRRQYEVRLKKSRNRFDELTDNLSNVPFIAMREGFPWPQLSSAMQQFLRAASGPDAGLPEHYPPAGAPPAGAQLAALPQTPQAPEAQHPQSGFHRAILDAAHKTLATPPSADAPFAFLQPSGAASAAVTPKAESAAGAAPAAVVDETGEKKARLKMPMMKLPMNATMPSRLDGAAKKRRMAEPDAAAAQGAPATPIALGDGPAVSTDVD